MNRLIIKNRNNYHVIPVDKVIRVYPNYNQDTGWGRVDISIFDGQHCTIELWHRGDDAEEWSKSITEKILDAARNLRLEFQPVLPLE